MRWRARTLGETHQLGARWGAVFRGVLGGFGFVSCFILWWVGGLGFVLCWLAKKMLGGCGLSRLCLRHGGLGQLHWPLPVKSKEAGQSRRSGRS